MLGAPVLQNAFTNRGFTVGADFGSGNDLRRTAAAVAWSPMSAKYQLSGGVAYLDPKFGSGTATYGARLMVPVFHRVCRNSASRHLSAWAARRLMVSPSGRSRSASRPVIGARSARTVVAFPAYVSPFYTWARVRENERDERRNGLVSRFGRSGRCGAAAGRRDGGHTRRGRRPASERPGARAESSGSVFRMHCIEPGER